jgi:uncharacterized protein
VILVDANIIMYAVGAEHPFKEPSLALLRAVVVGKVAAGTDAEVLQEVLHRYRSLRRFGKGEEAYRLARATLPRVFDITAAVMDAAAEIMRRHTRLAARDAVHLAVAEVNALAGVCSYDRGLDAVPGLRRVEPAALLGH